MYGSKVASVLPKLRNFQQQELLKGDIGSLWYEKIEEIKMSTKDIGKRFKYISLTD